MAVAQFFRYKRMTLSEMLSRYIHDQKLITVWTALICFAGAEPDRLSALFFILMWNSYHLHGYYYVEGGSQSISDALADVIREHGGTIKRNTLVTRVIVENGKAVEVRTADDACYTCRYVISNANAPDTLLKLVGREYLPDYYVKKIENLQTAISAFVVYLGVDYDYRSHFNGAHEIFKNESYDQHENFRYILEGIPEKAGFSITNYSVLDPSAAPQGKNVITITSQLPYDWQECWSWNNDHSAYNTFKDEVAGIFIKRAEEILPDLSQHIEIMEVGTPLTMKGYTLNPQGSILGWENTPEQSMDVRLPQQTPIENVLLAGSWTFPGGGQSAVMISGTMAAEAIFKKEQQKQ
jgi:prolycopene isomerase